MRSHRHFLLFRLRLLVEDEAKELIRYFLPTLNARFDALNIVVSISAVKHFEEWKAHHTCRSSFYFKTSRTNPLEEHTYYQLQLIRIAVVPKGSEGTICPAIAGLLIQKVDHTNDDLFRRCLIWRVRHSLDYFFDPVM